MLFQDMPDSMSLSFEWLIPSTILMFLFFIWIAFEGVRVQFKPSKIGANAMVGKITKVVDEVNQNEGRVFIWGEYWNAISDEKIEVNEKCKIV